MLDSNCLFFHQPVNSIEPIHGRRACRFEHIVNPEVIRRGEQSIPVSSTSIPNGDYYTVCLPIMAVHIHECVLHPASDPDQDRHAPRKTNDTSLLKMPFYGN
jgi:hypothetical protein